MRHWWLALALTACAGGPPCGYRREVAPAPVPGVTEVQPAYRLLEIVAPDGVLIPVRHYGEGGDRVPIVLAHGLQSHSGWFAQSGRFLGDRGHPTYLLDRRGSGLSRERRGHCRDFEEMLDDIHTVARHALAHSGAPRFHLIGHCFGAIPATAYAVSHPDLLQTLVLPTPGIHTLSDVSGWDKTRILFSKLLPGEACISVPLETSMFTDQAELEEWIRGDDLSLAAATASFYWEVPRARDFIDDHQGELTMPVFMALAQRDSICDNARNREFFAEIPAATKELREYPARHILEFSTSREPFFADLADWLDRQKP